MRKRSRVREAIGATIDFICNVLYGVCKLAFKLLEAIFD